MTPGRPAGPFRAPPPPGASPELRKGPARFLARPVLAGLLALLAAACGYRLQSGPGARFFDPSVVVELRPMTNASLVPDAGAFLSARLREEMRRSGFRGRFGGTGSDVAVEGRVGEVREEVFSKGADGFGLEYRLTLLVDIRVVEVARGRILWKEEGLAETTSYVAGPDSQYTESNRRMAFEEAGRRMARRIGQTLKVIL